MTPTAAKPMPQKTAAKLAEAQQSLMQMELASESSDEFRRGAANAITATRSVKDVLKKEIAGGNRVAKDHIEAAMAADAEMEHLVVVRDGHIHKGEFELDVDWLEESFPAETMEPGLRDFWRRFSLRRSRIRHQLHRTSRVLGMPAPVKEQVPRAFLPGISDRDAYTVVKQYLEKVTLAAQQAVELYT